MKEYLRSAAGKVLDILRKPDVSRRIYMITLAAALLILVLMIRGPERRGSFITDHDGNITGIRRNSLENSEQYDVYLGICEEERVTEEEVTLRVRAVNGRDVSSLAAGDEDPQAVREAEIDRMISDIELSDEEVISLPDELPDGTGLIWRARNDSGHTELYLIAALYISLIVLTVRSAAAGPAGEEALIRKEILRGLPRFCNQLFLMMNAGMILSDAFSKICASYREFGSEELTWFERSLTELSYEENDHRTSTAKRIYGFAVRHNVKEMIRIATILTENEKRGSDVIESLERESSYLWEDRKIVAREAGKMIDTRMTLPLALLLILLIVITMAPALLSM